jgi:hypothetical protein
MLQKLHTTSRASKKPTKYMSNAEETNSAAPPTHINILPSSDAGSLSSSHSIACRFASDDACGMNLLSILIAWAISI